MGRMKPGQRVLLAEIKRDMGVSLSVVREAMTRLASERLLHVIPQQGFSVWPLSVSDLEDLTRVRVEIETLTLRDSVAMGGVEWEADVVAAHHRLQGAERTGRVAAEKPNYAWMKAHAEFHESLAAACTSPLLKQLRTQYFEASELYRHWTVKSQLQDRDRTRSEHQGVRPSRALLVVIDYTQRNRC